ncbi:MAG: glycosyltransferase family 39 protein [Candidatus Aminicenantaceae bacterium]
MELSRLLPKKYNFYLIFIVIFTLLIVIKLNTLTAPFHWDVMGYAVPTTEAVYHNGVLIDKSSPINHPPLFFIVHALIWKIFGKSLLVSHLFNIVLGSLGLTFLFFLAKELYGSRVAVTATLLLTFNQIFFSQVGQVYLSIALMSTAILSVYFYLKKKYVLYIISASLMLLVKETSVVVLIAIIAFDFLINLFKKERIGKVIKRLALAAIPGISLLTWLFSHYLVTGWVYKTEDVFLNEGNYISLLFKNFIKHLIYDSSLENVNRVNWIIFLLVIVSTVIFIRKKSYKYEILFLLIIVGNVAFFSLTEDLPRYFLIIFPFYLLMGARALVMLANSFKYKNIILIAVIISITVLSVMNYHGTRNTDGWRLESNMEYLDMVRLHKTVGKFIEAKYPHCKVATTFPLIIAFTEPWYGYVKKPIQLITFQDIEHYSDVLIVWSSQSRNYEGIDRFIELNKKQLKEIRNFYYRGKIVKVYKKKSYTEL